MRGAARLLLGGAFTKKLNIRGLEMPNFPPGRSAGLTSWELELCLHVRFTAAGAMQ